MTDDGMLLLRWFATMDSDRPEEVLDFITEDFQMSIVFSRGTEGTDFSGDRAALVNYLEQRLKDVRRHTIITASQDRGHEQVLGEVRQAGVFEASFVAAARITPEGKVARLLIGRSPHTCFTDAVT